MYSVFVLTCINYKYEQCKVCTQCIVYAAYTGLVGSVQTAYYSVKSVHILYSVHCMVYEDMMYTK